MFSFSKKYLLNISFYFLHAESSVEKKNMYIYNLSIIIIDAYKATFQKFLTVYTWTIETLEVINTEQTISIFYLFTMGKIYIYIFFIIIDKILPSNKYENKT